MPAEVEHGWGHDNPSMAPSGCGDKLEFCGNRVDIFRDRQVKGEDIYIVAGPSQLLAICGEFQSGDFLDLAARRMVAGEPFGIEQGEAAGFCHGDRLGNAEYALIVITGIDANPQARDAIAMGGSFEVSIAQDFAAMGAQAADIVEIAISGGEQRAAVVYVPTKLVNANNAAD